MDEAGVDGDRIAQAGLEAGDELFDAEGGEGDAAVQRDEELPRRNVRIHGGIIP